MLKSVFSEYDIFLNCAHTENTNQESGPNIEGL